LSVIIYITAGTITMTSQQCCIKIDFMKKLEKGSQLDSENFRLLNCFGIMWIFFEVRRHNSHALCCIRVGDPVLKLKEMLSSIYKVDSSSIGLYLEDRLLDDNEIFSQSWINGTWETLYMEPMTESPPLPDVLRSPPTEEPVQPSDKMKNGEQDTECNSNESESALSDSNDYLNAAVDPFREQFYTEFDEGVLEEKIERAQHNAPINIQFESIGSAWAFNAAERLHRTVQSFQWEHLHIRESLLKNLPKVNERLGMQGPVTPLQKDLLTVMGNYVDLYYPKRTHENSGEIYVAVALHVLNHVLKTRSIIVRHRGRRKAVAGKRDECELEFRDLGLTRPKVLILAPFRHAAYCIVSTMIEMLFANSNGQSFVTNKRRFHKHYGPPGNFTPKHVQGKARHQLPLEFYLQFQGNRDDCFRLGLSIAKKSLKLFVDFYNSDVIVASPLGLRSMIGVEGEAHHEYDFLSSIEMVVLDQADVFLMQNWKHVIHVMQHLHRLPNTDHGVDYSSVRMWCLNGMASRYCQTVLLSSIGSSELRALLGHHCHNYSGLVSVVEPQQTPEGCIGSVLVSMKHIFHKIPDCETLVDEADVRFKFFTERILPAYKHSETMKRTLIYVPSFFDFVRLRNYLKKEQWSFVQTNEYTSEKKVSRARCLFYHGDKPILVLTERFHFFHRYVIRGIRHLLFYQLPTYSNFYPELCNMLLQPSLNKQNHQQTISTSTVLYSPYDDLRLSGLVGRSRADSMMSSATNCILLTGR
ncbi:Digestive organ expansion factor -like protein, partial [Trichinella pseudospiralis]